MWDQRQERQVLVQDSRIIPTYVGSTDDHGTENAIDTNHSHVCGINATTFATASDTVESFPRMWDQRTDRTRRTGLQRIIPTYVGSTPGLFLVDVDDANQSHVCGINHSKILWRGFGCESFPRMWDQPELPP